MLAHWQSVELARQQLVTYLRSQASPLKATSPVQEWRGAELERRNKRKSVSASRQLDMILPRGSDEAAKADAELRMMVQGGDSV